jgi:exodeoxyribonuclease VII large subunit
VADLVADARAATPTHAAQLVAPVRDDLLAGLAGLRGRLRRAVGSGFDGRRRHLRALRAELGDPTHLVSTQRHRLDDLGRRAEAGAMGPVEAGRARLERLRVRLARTEPRARLRALGQRVAASRRRLDGWQAATFRREALRLAALQARLEPANVARLLKRGFALALQEGRLVTRSAALAPGQPLRVGLGEGWVDAEVRAIDAGDDPVPGRSRGGAG